LLQPRILKRYGVNFFKSKDKVNNPAPLVVQGRKKQEQREKEIEIVGMKLLWFSTSGGYATGLVYFGGILPI
jgi:hypothetical protein